MLITAVGLKDRHGLLRAELYPPDDDGFLADDNVLLNSGRVFRRARDAHPARRPGPPLHPRSGAWRLHDRARSRSRWRPEIQSAPRRHRLSGNPRLGLAKPRAAAARLQVTRGVVETRIVLNYRHGFFAFAPIDPR